MRVRYARMRVTRIGHPDPESTMSRNETRPEPVRKIKCKYCNNEFKPRRSWQLFCKSKCRFSYHNDVNAPLRTRTYESI